MRSRLQTILLQIAIAATINSMGGAMMITSLGLRLLVSSKIAWSVGKIRNWIKK